MAQNDPRTFHATWFAEPGGGSTMSPDVAEPTVDLDLPPAAEAFVVGRYTILGQLGEGGMGVVLDAQQEHPRRRVALKLIRPERLTVDARRRFHEEVHLLGRLLHPGIPQVYEAGEADDQLYLAMERVEGLTLDEWAKDKDIRAKVRVLALAAQALHHAHLRGVVHRDIKPANVLVTAENQPKVLDFGIAATLRDPDAAPTLQVSGTPAFMAPEQLAGGGDQRVDVYALGVTAYLTLCGTMPLLVPSTTAEAVRAYVTETPAPLASTHDRRLRGDIDAILQKALEKKPADRYQDASEFAADLGRFLAKEPVLARPATPGYRTLRLVQRRPYVAAALALLAFFVVTGVALLSVQLMQVRSARTRAETAAHDAEQARAAQALVSDDLMLMQARAAIATDPAQALTWLQRLSDDANWREAGAVRFQALAAGPSIRELWQHSGEVRAVALSSDGKTAYTGSYDDRVLRWPIGADRPSELVLTHDADVTIVVVSADDSTVVSAGRDGHVRLSSAVGSQAIHLHAGEIDVLVLHGEQGLSGDDKGGVRRWRLDGGELDRAELGSGVTAGAVDALGVAWLGLEDGRVLSWVSGSEPQLEWTHAAPVAGLAIPGQVVSAAEDGTVRWSGRASKILAHNAPIRGVYLGPDQRVLSTDRAGYLQTWNADGSPGPSDDTGGGVVRDAYWTASGIVVTGHEDGIVRAWMPDTGRRWQLRGHTARIRDVHVVGDRLITGAADGSARLWSLKPPPLERLRGHADAVSVIVRGGQLLSGGEDGSVLRWDLGSGQSESVARHDAGVESIAASGQRVASGDRDGQILDGERRAELGEKVRRLVLFDGGRQLAAATASGDIAVWDRASFTSTMLRAHSKKIEDLGVDLQDRLVSASADGTVRRWTEAGVGTVLLALDVPASVVAVLPDATVMVGDQAGNVHQVGVGVVMQHGAPVTAIAADPDGRFATGSSDGTVLFSNDGPVVAPLSAPVAALLFHGESLYVVAGRWLVEVDTASGEAAVLLHAARPLRGLALVDGHLVVGEGPDMRMVPIELPNTAAAVRAPIGW